MWTKVLLITCALKVSPLVPKITSLGVANAPKAARDSGGFLMDSEGVRSNP